MTIAAFPALLDTARTLADRFALTAARHDETGAFPFANFEQLHAAGLLRLTSGLENGGLGGGLTEARAVISEIARGEPSTALVLAMHLSHHNAISRSGKWPKHLVERVSAANLAGPALVNSAQVEPRVGSPSHGSLPETVARRDGALWRLSGHKTYATGIPGLKFVNVLAVTDEAIPRLGSFLVPAGAEGLSVVETWNATGMRGTASHDIILENVAVPFEDTIDLNPATDGIQRDAAGMAWYFLSIASVYQGIARAAGNWITEFASSFSPGSLGRPIATVPRFEDGLGEIEYRLAINERLLRTTAEDADAMRPLGIEPALVKHHVIENAVAVTALALDLGGNPGLKRSHPLERHHRDALCGRAHAPQNSIIRAMAAKAALGRGLPRPATTPETPAEPNKRRRVSA